MTALLPAMLIAAVVTFVATNIDDLVLLTGCFQIGVIARVILPLDNSSALPSWSL